MSRKPLGYKPINPRIRNNFLDSCAFDPKYAPEDQASLKIFQLYEDGELVLNIAHSNQKEIEHPNTPNWVKSAAQGMIYTIETSLTDQERSNKSQILSILAGNGNPEKMAKDAEHVFEASKYGGYFVTTDERILKKKPELEGICAATIVKPNELLDIMAIYENT
jgi:hypothetical protein